MSDISGLPRLDFNTAPLQYSRMSWSMSYPTYESYCTVHCPWFGLANNSKPPSSRSEWLCNLLCSWVCFDFKYFLLRISHFHIYDCYWFIRLGCVDANNNLALIQSINYSLNFFLRTWSIKQWQYVNEVLKVLQPYVHLLSQNSQVR